MRVLSTVALVCLSLAFDNVRAPFAAAESSDVERDHYAAKTCNRGAFNDYYLQNEGGDPPASYKGRIFKLSQDYPVGLPPKEDYPWLDIAFENGGPIDPEAYLRALLAYGLEGNVDVDFYVEDNPIRAWYGMPWMDWNTEVTADWPGTDGREFVHGLTHEFDSFPGTLSAMQSAFVDTWSGAYFNDRAAFSIGQVYCNPDDPRPDMLNPDPVGLNNMPDGAYIIKLLFSTVADGELPTVRNALEWQANIFANPDPSDRNSGPMSKFERTMGTVRLIQIDVSVRDTRSTTGWLMGTFGYDARATGETPWERMVPLGLQWGNNPTVTYAETCAGPDGPCTFEKLTEQWINLAAVKTLATPPLHFNHLGFGGRLAGPVDNPKASCMGCHQTAGFPNVAILPEFGPNAALLDLDAQRHPELSADYRMMFYGNVPSGVVFSDTQLYSADYSLQLSMSLQNFISRRCAPDVTGPQPRICNELSAWAEAQARAANALLTFGRPAHDGAPIAPK